MDCMQHVEGMSLQWEADAPLQRNITNQQKGFP